MFNSLYIEPEDGKEEEMFQVAGNCLYIEWWNCITWIKDLRCNSSMRLDILSTLMTFVEVDSFINSRTIDMKLVYYRF